MSVISMVTKPEGSCTGARLGLTDLAPDCNWPSEPDRTIETSSPRSEALAGAARGLVLEADLTEPPGRCGHAPRQIELAPAREST
jgi:hypothetical protein